MAEPRVHAYELTDEIRASRVYQIDQAASVVIQQVMRVADGLRDQLAESIPLDRFDTTEYYEYKPHKAADDLIRLLKEYRKEE